MAEDIQCAVVIDTGAGYCKADLSFEDNPKCIFPTVIGKPKMNGSNIDSESNADFDAGQKGFGKKDYYVGYDALSKQGLLDISRPIQRGHVKDWDDLEKIYHHCFINELKIDSTERPVLTTIYPHEQKPMKEKSTQVFFETFSVPGYYCYSSSLLALYGSGKTTGVVIDSGEDITSVLPINEGSPITYAQSI